MAFLEIVYLNGDVDRRPLEKQQPVSIGSHSSNDIRIDEDGVESMHCRVSWNKKAFEAVAAGVEGIEVNGNVVQRAVLKPGDVLRFGSVDLKFFEKEAEAAERPLVSAHAAPDSGSLVLKPLSDELDVPDWLKGESEAKAKPSPKPEPKPKPAAESPPSRPKMAKAIVSEPAAKPEKPKPEKPRAEKIEKPPVKAKAAPPPADDDVGDFDLDAGLEALAQESRSAMPTFGEEEPEAEADERPKSRSKPAPMAKHAAPSEPAAEPPTLESMDAPAPKAAILAPNKDRVRDALRHSRSRPGEEDVFKSPLVIGLASAAVVALILAAIFYFVGFRRSVQEEF